ncbi:MAG TPA: nuclear transport factor 2 family protein [Sphingomonadaceae bacterium]|nr:nuclear transport factor 2 family protein [Sphingomonadaceae bacterium]
MGATQENGDQATAVQALLDRLAIQDLFSRYYLGLDAGDPEGFGRYFVEDAELDVNGLVARGHVEIADLYRKVSADKPRLTGTFRMLMTNPLIEVNGDTATAQMLWTQTLNDTIKGPPRLIEQGREFDRLVKQNGRWRIVKRVVIADSGLPDLFDDTYTTRTDYTLSPE